jgi:hypothetical protein
MFFFPHFEDQWWIQNQIMCTYELDLRGEVWSEFFLCTWLLQWPYHVDDHPSSLVQCNRKQGSCVGCQHSSQGVWQY